MKRPHYLILLAIIALAVGLRLLGGNSREIQYDDAFSIFLSQQSLTDIVKGTAADTMPPLFYFVLHYWMILAGANLIALRALSVLFSLLTLLVFFDLGRLMFNPEAGLCTAFLAAISPLQIYHAQDIRMYALFELSQAIYFWCFYSMFVKLKTNRFGIGWWIGLILSGSASMYTHNLAIFGLVIPDLFLLIQRKWKDLLHLVAAQAVILVLALPWLMMIPGQIEKIQQAFWTPRPGLVEILQAALLFVVNLPLKGVLLVIAGVFAAQILIITIIELVRQVRLSVEVRFLVMVAFLLPGMLFAASYLMRPVFVTRGFLISSMAYYALGGYIIANRVRRGIGTVLAITFIAAAAISLPSFYTFREFPRSAFREASAYLTQTAAPGELILHDNKLSFFPSHYYQPELAQEFLADEPGSANDTFATSSQQAMKLYPTADIHTAATGHESMYFVVFQEAIDEYHAMGKANHPVLEWLEQNYKKVEIESFSDLRLYHFSQ